MSGLPPARYRNGMLVQAAEPHLLASDGWPYERTTHERNLEQLATAVSGVSQVAELIELGIAVMAPHHRIVLSRQQGILSATRHDLRDDELLRRIESPLDEPATTSDVTQGSQLSRPDPLTERDRRIAVMGNASYYLNKTVAIADALGASYVPHSRTAWSLFEVRAQRAARELQAKGIDLKVAAALNESSLPLLADLDAATLVRARQDEEAFEAWRRALRRAVRQVRAGVNQSEFAAEASDVLRDELDPLAEEVRRAVSRRQAFRSASRERLIGLSTGVAGSLTAGAITGGPALAAVGAGISAVGAWTLGALLPRRQVGERAVIATLVRRS